MEHYTAEPQQKTEKRTWITPQLELISTMDILGGSASNINESRSTRISSRNGTQS